jgi:hypothetical protein
MSWVLKVGKNQKGGWCECSHISNGRRDANKIIGMLRALICVCIKIIGVHWSLNSKLVHQIPFDFPLLDPVLELHIFLFGNAIHDNVANSRMMKCIRISNVFE